MADLTVVMPTRGGPVISSALTALAAQPRADFSFDVHVVADALAHPETEERLRGLGKGGLDLRVYRASVPGASAARNVGWRQSDAELVLFLDDDVLLDPGALEQHLLWHRAHPEPNVGVLGFLRWADSLRITPFMRWLEMGAHFDFGRIRGEEAAWYCFYACQASVKREMLARVDGFDEVAFPFHYEDLDLAKRMDEHGFRLLFNRRATAQHLKRETIESWSQRIAEVARAEHRFADRYPEIPPYFFTLFSEAFRERAARGRLGRFAAVVKPTAPVLGGRVWASYDAVCRQRLAKIFLAAWAEPSS